MMCSISSNIAEYIQMSRLALRILTILKHPLNIMDVFEYLQLSFNIEAKDICKHPCMSLNVHDVLKDTFKCLWIPWSTEDLLINMFESAQTLKKSLIRDILKLWISFIMNEILQDIAKYCRYPKILKNGKNILEDILQFRDIIEDIIKYHPISRISSRISSNIVEYEEYPWWHLLHH